MIDSSFRSPYQQLIIDPLLKISFIRKLPPKACTLLATLSGIATLPALIFTNGYLALTLLLLSGFFDTLDGSLARACNSTSDSGALLDICSDRLVEFTTVLALYLIHPETRALLCMLILGSILLCVTSFLTVGVFTQNDSKKSFHYNPGIMERTEAFTLFGLMILFPALFPYLATLFILLTTLTALIRIYQFIFQK